MAEAVEIQMARLQEQLKAVISTLAEAREAHREVDQQMTAIAVTLSGIDKRLETVEHQLAKSEPTIEEFITFKHQVRGAGKAGAIAWAIGGFIIATLFQSRTAIRDFFMLP